MPSSRFNLVRWPGQCPRSCKAVAANSGGEVKYYALQAAIVACHMRARAAEETDWERIVLLYDALMQTAPSPIVSLNRAVAVSMAQGPAAGLDALDAIAALAGNSALWLAIICFTVFAETC